MLKYFDELLCLLASILFSSATIFLWFEYGISDILFICGFAFMFFTAIFLALIGKHLGD